MYAKQGRTEQFAWALGNANLLLVIINTVKLQKHLNATVFFSKFWEWWGAGRDGIRISVPYIELASEPVPVMCASEQTRLSV